MTSLPFSVLKFMSDGQVLTFARMSVLPQLLARPPWPPWAPSPAFWLCWCWFCSWRSSSSTRNATHRWRTWHSSGPTTPTAWSNAVSRRAVLRDAFSRNAIPCMANVLVFFLSGFFFSTLTLYPIHTNTKTLRFTLPGDRGIANAAARGIKTQCKDTFFTSGQR